MKIQYLGDSRDSFKWDYQDHLTDYLGYPELKVVPMLTRDDTSNHGQTSPNRFPARPEVIAFCELLRSTRNLSNIRKLPDMTGAAYRVDLHMPDTLFSDESRGTYFGITTQHVDSVVFLDPDNGFEPKKCTEKHVSFEDVEGLLDQVTVDSVVSVFQYYRRKKFEQDFYEIQEKILSGHATAIFGRYVMFVSISRSKKAIESVIKANMEYKKGKRLGVITDLPKEDTLFSIEQVLDALNKHRVRATYSAVARLVGTTAWSLAGEYLGRRRPYASWVVSKSTGMPTKYLPEDRHPDLLSSSHVIQDAAELEELIRRQ